MDRLARSMGDLTQLVGELTGRGVRVEFVTTERLTFDPGGEDPFATFQLRSCSVPSPSSSVP